VFVENAVEVVFAEGVPTGVRLRWTFDETASASLRQGHTGSASGPLTEADVRALEQGAFGTLADRRYFTVVRLDGRPQSQVEARDFSAQSVDGKLSYAFTVPIDPAAWAEAGGGKIEVFNFDPEYFLSFALTQADPVRASGDAGGSAECGARADKRRAGLWGLVPVDVAVCTFSP
jgi:ABC-type uncharacterized transport system substrate-binding protein